MKKLVVFNNKKQKLFCTYDTAEHSGILYLEVRFFLPKKNISYFVGKDSIALVNSCLSKDKKKRILTYRVNISEYPVGDNRGFSPSMAIKDMANLIDIEYWSFISLNYSK